MGRQVRNKMEAYIKEDVIEHILSKHKWTYDDLLNRLKDKYGIDIGYKMFAKLLKNQGNWRLTYAFVLCDYLEMELNSLFYLAKSDHLES